MCNTDSLWRKLKEIKDGESRIMETYKIETQERIKTPFYLKIWFILVVFLGLPLIGLGLVSFIAIPILLIIRIKKTKSEWFFNIRRYN